MDFRAVILVLVVAILIYYYLGFKIFLFCALAGIIIAIFAFLYTLLRAEGELAVILNFYRRTVKKYERFESRIFRWWDDL